MTGEFAQFLAWARAKQAKYECDRAMWRARHPLIDVGELERLHGITRETMTIEQLRKSAPPVILK